MRILPPHPGWLPFLKMFFGIIALLMLCLLAGMVALGKVEEKTSYGFHDIVTILAVLSGSFANWAFSTAKDGMASQEDKYESSDGKLS